MGNKLKIVWNGILPGNPVLVLLLGMCATLGTTSSAQNGLMMGMATGGVLICSNIVISMIKSLVPDKVRIPVFIVVIATFVTMLQMAISAWLPALNASLGIFIPLIVVNCILLGRAEAYASRNSVIDSALDGLGCGLGFTLALTLLGGVRELLGTGSLFGCPVFSEDYGMLLFVLAPGAFIALGYLIALTNALLRKIDKKS
ncbi:MAG: electron transport complex subunit E [Muribaculaceae bacterium]|nr:electron transport complex subunit E [Muribaculaceae bacterium]